MLTGIITTVKDLESSFQKGKKSCLCFANTPAPILGCAKHIAQATELSHLWTLAKDALKIVADCLAYIVDFSANPPTLSFNCMHNLLR